ncbi:hypothetical protein NM208_g14283 [Fusarium decemcellulare]|uniref:Uncharacterized protein n=1 Tax=Fusarium decemcellulare TaxID=57161 RepID=A0ACC1RH79_9HYPO|nr:hypothetical protein NM208_g14283 [Fusarium decemcellulare]
MSNNVKVVDGVLVTNTEVPPPTAWTNDYEEIGGDMRWGEYGDIAEEVRGRGIEGEIKPLFGMQPYTGEAMVLFQVGSDQFYLFNAIDGSLFQILSPSDLQEIASTIDNEDMGLGALEIEAL